MFKTSTSTLPPKDDKQKSKEKPSSESFIPLCAAIEEDNLDKFILLYKKETITPYRIYHIKRFGIREKQ